MSAAVEGAGRDPPLTALRLRLRANGFPPVPVSGPHMRVKSAGKRPVMEDWRRVCAAADEAEVRRWAIGRTELHEHRHPVRRSGLSRYRRADAGAGRADREPLADSMLGHTSLRRIGQAPKSLLAYRTIAPLPKMATPELFLPDGTKAAGGNPRRRSAVRRLWRASRHWPRIRLAGNRPRCGGAADLPVADEGRLRAFVAAAEAMLREAGGQTKAEREAAKGRPLTALPVEAR